MKRGILKKAVGFTMACVMAFSFAGCAGNSESGSASAGGSSAGSAAAGGQKVIKFFHRFPDEPYNGFIESKLHEYEKSHPDIKFDIMSAQNQDYKEKIKVVVGGDDTPDIFFSWAGDFTERFIRENLILDLTPYMDKDPEWKNSLLENQMSIYTTKDGMIYGIPFRLDSKQFFYNTEIFEKNGIEVPKTFDDLLAACAKLKAAGITPIAYGNSEPWAGLHYIGTLNQIYVPDSVREKDYEPTTGSFTDPGYVQAMKSYQKLLPYMTENPDGVKPDMARSMFAMGQAAIYYGELIEIPYIKTDGPDLKFGMFKFPEVVGAKGNQEILTGAPEGFVISSKTKYPQECVDFLKWFLGKEVGTEQCQKIGWFNAAKDTTSGLTDQSLIDGYKVVSEAKQMSEWLDNALYSTVSKEYQEEVSKLTNGTVSPEEAMKKIQAKAKEAQTLVKSGQKGE
ncbi:extracellular solute-binding protein [Caproiciproducens galactitolivorans]|uniref:Multiple sugar-binding protein n=1 Tax=Caproiciproducens galactitolivorans TaxID=642589 RepID=A0A4Z0YD78_9FIRM|nr:extracellular solute-binding protein [Caproiciproducens galactitolivorans]QEY35169.1 extracellular solute-binding protein [Caproiciproducens galactitolivorans]TGJ76860.1 multiple sugar-binding protein precursor [Caproiciproducens galactitolivorans]